MDIYSAHQFGTCIDCPIQALLCICMIIMISVHLNIVRSTFIANTIHHLVVSGNILHKVQ